MKLNEYQKVSRKTATYPNVGSNPVYPVLGLGGEAGELLDKAIKGAPLEDFGNELGDVLWYVAQLATEAGFNLEELKTPSCHASHLAKPGRKDAALSKKLSVELSKLCTSLVITIAAVSECTKKMWRDDQGELTKQRKEKLFGLLSEVLTAWHLVAYHAGIEPGTCARNNCAKLASRQKRGVLGGSGDNR